LHFVGSMSWMVKIVLLFFTSTDTINLYDNLYYLLFPFLRLLGFFTLFPICRDLCVADDIKDGVLVFPVPSSLKRWVLTVRPWAWFVKLTLFGNDLNIKRAIEPEDSAGMRLYHDNYLPPYTSVVFRIFVLDWLHCLARKTVNSIFCYDWLL